jgi:hypothetical protein
MNRIAVRHYCRFDRTKLSEPTDNPKRAFCCRGCFNSFYRSRCVVCESPIRRKNERQKTCIDVRCKADLQQFPLAYSWPEKRLPPSYPSAKSVSPSKNIDFIGLETGDRVVRGPVSYRCLSHWYWENDLDVEWRLFTDRDQLAARINLRSNVWTLTWPRTIGVQSRPMLEDAKQLAISIAVNNLIDAKTTARLARANTLEGVD